MSEAINSNQPILVKPTALRSRNRLAGSTSAQNCKLNLASPNKEAKSDIVISSIAIPHKWKNININTNQNRITESKAGGISLTGNTVANPTVVTCSVPHLICTGDSVTISGSNSTPVIDGTHTITVLSSTTFSIPVNVTIAGTVGDIDSVTYTSVTTPADYNITAMGAYLSTQVSANSPFTFTYTFAYESHLDVFTVDTLATELFIIHGSDIASTMKTLIGFTADSASAITASSDVSPVASAITDIDMHIGTFSDGVTSDPAGLNDIFATIPIKSTFNELLVYEPSQLYKLVIRNFHSIVSFRLTVNYGNGLGDVDLPSNGEWTMSLLDLEIPSSSFISQEGQFVKNAGR
jgi:hypothetical protein